jgi:hypothetical protein
MEPAKEPWTVTFADFGQVEKALRKLSADQLRVAKALLGFSSIWKTTASL